MMKEHRKERLFRVGNAVNEYIGRPGPDSLRSVHLAILSEALNIEPSRVTAYETTVSGPSNMVTLITSVLA